MAGQPGTADRAHVRRVQFGLGDRPGRTDVPCETLTLQIEEQDFSRPFMIEQMFDQDNPPQTMHLGAVAAQPGQRGSSVEINLQRAVQGAGDFRLTIQDSRNPPLTISGVSYRRGASKSSSPLNPP